MFTHLHVHSYYSLLSGASSPAALCREAKELGYDALALTDTNNLSGALAFLTAARAAGIRPIFGVELTQSLPAAQGGAYALVLARDQAGFSELCGLISARQLDQGFDLGQALARSTPHVFVIVSDPGLGQTVLAGRRAGVYLEVTDPSARGNPGRTALRVQQAAAHGLPAVITNGVHFARPEEYGAHRALCAVRLHTALDGLPPGTAAAEASYLKEPQAMQQRFAHLPAVLGRTARVAAECQGLPFTGKFLSPPYPCPPGENEFEYLSRLCFQGVRERYHPVTPAAISRLARELEVIEQKNFSGYFLVVWDIATEAKRRGIPTVGRGSAAGSIVSYCLGITHVDPLAHGLFFERFLNPEREDPPDIDLDFPWDQRDEMLDYAYQRFDPERVAMICTTIRLHGRSAVREAGRVLGLTEMEISRFSRRLPHWGSVADLTAAKQEIPEARDVPLGEEPWKTVLSLARRLENVPRHLSVHPGGIVITPRPIAEVMPREMSAKGVVVTQYDMYAAEDAGLVKIDLLGQRGLAVIRDVVRAAGVDWTRVDPCTDAATKKLLREGKSLGCFYVESPAMRLLLRKLQCDDFELLTAASSVIRPGVSNSGMMKMFVERRLGRQAVRYAHPRLRAILQDTYGVMVYQEDVIKVVHAIAGMSLGEADKLRRCMSKKRHWEKMETYQQRFLQGAQERGVPPPAGREIWRQIEAFGGYAFCKAHSASYAQLSFQSAYLKAHYPALFMAAVLSNQGGFYPPAAYLEEARRLGLGLHLPDINRSAWRYLAESNSVRVGFLAIKGLSQEHAEALVTGRESGGPFRSLRDLLQRTPLSREEAEALIAAGACDSLDPNRTRLMWEVALQQRARAANARTLELGLETRTELPRLPDWDAEERLSQEFEQLSLSPRAHPLMLHRQKLSQLAAPGTVAARDLAQHAGQRVRVFGWLVTWRRNRVHKTGEMMKFMTLEDLTDIFEVTIFPRAYREHGHKLIGHGPYVVEGIVENDRGGLTITAERVDNLGLQRQKE